MIKKALTIALLVCASTQSFAQPNIQPGQYITERGWGTLTVTKAKDGITKFDIGAMGDNGHSCSIDGDVLKNVAIVGDEPEMKCIVKFKEDSKGINVEPVGDGCRYYCGMRAGFEGTYMKVAKECTSSEVDKTRKEFLALYKGKKYEESVSKLEPVVNNCSATIFWLDMGRMRNDLAVAYAKVNKFAECAKVLAPLKEDAAKSKDDIQGEYSPMDADMYWPIVKSTKTNMKLCKVK